MENNIKLYSLPTCPRCKVIKTKLSQAGIQFDECQDIDVMQDMDITSAPALAIRTDSSSEFKIIRDFGEINALVNELIKGVGK